jgi:hypothetical protein
MANTIDMNAAAQKKRKQTIALCVLGAILLVVLLFQLPKLTGGGSKGTTAAPATDTSGGTTSAEGTTIVASGTDTTVAATTGAVTTTTAPKVPAGVPRAVLVGVTVGAGAPQAAGEGQLRAFTLFTAKDPFVQSLPATPTATTSSSVTPSGSSSSGSGGSSGSGSATPTAPPTLVNATISVNGTSEALTVKDLFPEKDQLFKLVSLKGKTAKIGVSGGAFTDGQLITLALGKSVTLVNTATGARYVVKLLYLGVTPEQVEGFTKKPAEPKK